MKDKMIATEIKLRKLLQRVEKLRNIPLTYEVLAKYQKIKIKIDELDDLITEIEAEEEF